MKRNFSISVPLKTKLKTSPLLKQKKRNKKNQSEMKRNLKISLPLKTKKGKKNRSEMKTKFYIDYFINVASNLM